MSKFPRLAIFDVDGTIANNGMLAPNILEAFKHLNSMGCITTVSSGRGYMRLREMFGDNFETLISSDALIILEHGTKIVDRNGKVVFGEFLGQEEKEHIIDFIRANIELYRLAWFSPEDVTKKLEMWCLDERDLQHEINQRGKYANIFTSSIGEFREKLINNRVTGVSLRFKQHIKVDNLKLNFTRTDTVGIFQDSNFEFIKNNTNKGLSLLYSAKHYNINLCEILVAGNAINDVEMLDIGVGTSILIGEANKRSEILAYLSSTDRIVKLNTPNDLANYILGLK